MDIITQPFFGLAVFAAAYILSRVINERGLKMLNADEKARLLDGFSKTRLFSSVAVIVVLGVLILSDKLIQSLPAGFSLAFPLAIISVLLTLNFIGYKKLKTLDLPKEYVKNYLLSVFFQLIGIIFLFAPVFIKNFS